MKSVMGNQFSVNPKVDIPRSLFDRSHGYKTCFDAGLLVPFYIDDVMPGDTFKCNTTAFIRMNTPHAPLMDNQFADFFYFFVPYRLIWSNSRKFFGEQTSPGDSIDYTIPTVTTPATTGVSAGSLSDYLGVPIGIPDLELNALYHRAYRMICHEWFRDQNLQNSLVPPTDDGPDVFGVDYSDGLFRRGKRHDYFTSCLPWPQKGDAVTIPIGTSAPVSISADGNILYTNGTTQGNIRTVGSGTNNIQYSTTTSAAANLSYVSGLEGIADLSSATAQSINDLREAFQVQRLLERDARGGTRYSEIIKSHFSVDFFDVTYRPEYLGGGTTSINITPVAQTISSPGVGFTGDLGGYGTAVAKNGFTKSFNEHGIVMGLVATRADLTYQQGLNRFFSKQTRYDYYWPTLAYLGEQAVLNKEIYAQGSLDTTDDDVFGYQERWAEYRYKPSQITGILRSTYATSLDIWHLSQEFSSLPVLNTTFIQENPPLDRVVTVPSEPHYIMDSYISLKCARPMPVRSVPGYIDHF